MMTTNDHARKRLGAEIKRLLGNHTQEWLAEEARIGQSTVSRLIHGSHETSPRTLRRVARALRVDERYLLDLAVGITPEEGRDAGIAYIARRLENLPPPQRQIAIEAVRGVVEGFYDLLAGAAVEPDAWSDESSEAWVRLSTSEASVLVSLLGDIAMPRQENQTGEGDLFDKLKQYPKEVVDAILKKTKEIADADRDAKQEPSRRRAEARADSSP